MKLKTRIIATTASLAVLISGLLLTGAIAVYDRSIANNELDMLRNASDQLTGELSRASRTSLELATAMAALPTVRQSIETKDRAIAAAMLVPIFDELKGRYGYERFHLHTPPGINFFRAHNPSRFGDDDTAVPTIAEAFRTGQPTVGLEGGENGTAIAMRGSAPVMREGLMIGLVQIGLGLTDSTLQTIQLAVGSDLRVQMLDAGGKWNVRAKTADLPQFHSSDRLTAVLQGTPSVASRMFGSFNLSASLARRVTASESFQSASVRFLASSPSAPFCTRAARSIAVWTIDSKSLIRFISRPICMISVGVSVALSRYWRNRRFKVLRPAVA